jgi:hypothetical protein
VNENGTDAATAAAEESAAALADGVVVDPDIVPEHFRLALEEPTLAPAGRGLVLRAFLSLVLGVLFAGGAAWSTGLIPSPFSLVP